MQIKIFSISAFGNEESIREFNHFLKTVRVIELKKEFVDIGTESYWSFCLTYFPIGDEQFKSKIKEKVDYKEILDEQSFEKFTVLRKLRKQIADKDAVPAYAVFTDIELAEIAKLPELSHESLMKINGIGSKKVAKYGDELCSLFLETMN